MKQIVFVVGNYKNGGVSMRSTNLANEFGRRGHDVTILVTKGIAENIFFELHKNVKLVSLRQYVETNKANKQIVNELKRQKQYIKIIKELRYITRFVDCIDKHLEKMVRSIRKSSDLRCYAILNPFSIFIPFGLSYYEQTYYGIKGTNCKVIYAERNAPELEVPADTGRAKELLSILGKANGAVFQTRDEVDYYKPYISVNTAVIHNPIKKNLPIPFEGERRKVIVNFCRMSMQKNLHLLIDAFSMLINDYPEYSLEIYGNTVEENEAELKNELIQYITVKGLEKRIHILPPAADVHKRVRDCAMFVSSSDFEGLSNSMIEAMAIGLPCVCTDCLGGGAREMIKNEKNGLLVPMKDVDALYKGMKRMIDDPELAIRCGVAASNITKEMSVEIIGDQWLSVIERV